MWFIDTKIKETEGMNNKGFSKGILFVLFLALTFGWMVSGKWVEASASAPALEYIYTGEDDETGQLVVFAVDTHGEALESATLNWQSDGLAGCAKAVELVDGYAAFLLEDVTLSQENMETLSVTCQGMTYDLDLQAFGQESDVVTASLEEENEEELPLAQDSDEIVSGLAEAEALTEETAGTGSEVVLTPGNGLNRASNDIVIVLDPGHGG
jgi:N-acetylmuramoyl-L-alanine amidase